MIGRLRFSARYAVPMSRDEGRRRVRVASGAGPVDPARGDRAADDEDALVRGFHRVVRAREQLYVGGRSGILAVRSELGEPVAVQVRLVPHDVLADARERA